MIPVMPGFVPNILGTGLLFRIFVRTQYLAAARGAARGVELHRDELTGVM